MKLVEIFGARLKYWREKRGLSLTDLERKCGVHRSLINKYENARKNPSLYTVERLLDTLNVNIIEFFEEES